MIYEIGQKFLVQGIEARVVHINRNKAWVAPTEDIDLGEGRVLLSCTSFEVLNEKGRDSKGKKAIPITNQECGAV